MSTYTKISNSFFRVAICKKSWYFFLVSSSVCQKCQLLMSWEWDSKINLPYGQNMFQEKVTQRWKFSYYLPMEIGVKFLGLHGKTVLQFSPKQLKQTLTCLKKEIEISELQDTWTTQEKLYRSILSFYFSQKCSVDYDIRLPIGAGENK